MKAIIFSLFQVFSLEKFLARQKSLFNDLIARVLLLSIHRSWKQKTWTDLKKIKNKIKGISSLEDKRQNAERLHKRIISSWNWKYWEKLYKIFVYFKEFFSGMFLWSEIHEFMKGQKHFLREKLSTLISKTEDSSMENFLPLAFFKST